MTAYPTHDEELVMLQAATPGSRYHFLASLPVTIPGDPVGSVIELPTSPTGIGGQGASRAVLILVDHSRDGLEGGNYYYDAVVVHDEGSYDSPGRKLLVNHAEVRRGRDLSGDPAVAAAAKRIVDHLTEAEKMGEMLENLETAFMNVAKDH